MLLFPYLLGDMLVIWLIKLLLLLHNVCNIWFCAWCCNMEGIMQMCIWNSLSTVGPTMFNLRKELFAKTSTSQSFSSDTLQGISSEWSGDTTELVYIQKRRDLIYIQKRRDLIDLTNEISSFLYINQFRSISTSFWRYPLKSVRRKALGWISYFTPFSNFR